MVKRYSSSLATCNGIVTQMLSQCCHTAQNMESEQTSTEKDTDFHQQMSEQNNEVDL